MIALIQRVSQAHVEVEMRLVARIQRGILALVAIEQEDTAEQAKRLVQRIINYRIFPDNAGKMNFSLQEIQAELLLVPQFTLAADTKRGNRPSFSSGASPEIGQQVFEQLLMHAKQDYSKVQQGIFGADMQLTLTNDGPVTFWLEVR